MGATVGFLHTSAVHRPVFRALVAEIAETSRVDVVDVVDVVDEGLLVAACAEGIGGPEIAAAVAGRLDELMALGADRVVCTCSTIGGLAEQVGGARGRTVVRVDRAMVERAVEAGGRIVVLAASASTIEPTRRLLAEVAATAGRGVAIDVRIVEAAWGRFEAGDGDGYRRLIADAIRAALPIADVIVLAQASMAPAALLVDAPIPVLSSPRLAVEAVVGDAVFHDDRPAARP